MVYSKKVRINVFSANFTISDLFKWVVSKPFERLFLSTYSLSKHPQIIGILEELDRIGKSKPVYFLINSQFYKTTYELRKFENIYWLYSDKIHSKIIMADNGRVVFGSGNLTAHIGRFTSWDVMVAVEDRDLYYYLLKTTFIPAIQHHRRITARKLIERTKRRLRSQVRKKLFPLG